MHVRTLAVVTLLLAGCSATPASHDDAPLDPTSGPTPTAGPPAASAPPGAGNPATALTHDSNHTLVLRQAYAGPPVPSATLPGNCILLRAGPTILGGNITASWTQDAGSPGELEAVVQTDVEDVDNRTHLSGPAGSPFTWSFPALANATGHGYLFGIQVPDTGLAMAQEVQMRLRFSYEGTMDFQDEAVGCHLK